MAKGKQHYWLGKGRIKVSGVWVGQGDPFDHEKVDKGTLKKWKSAKPPKVGTAPFIQTDDPAGDDMALLQGRLSDMKAAAKTDGDKIAGLQLEVEELGKNSDVIQLKKDIVELESEVKRLEGEAKEAAEKKADHVKAHAAGKTDAKTEKKDEKK